MTQRFYIQCPSCGHIYQIKLQVDQNIFLFDWPIVIECKECGDVIHGVYGTRGLSLKQLPLENFSDKSIVTTMIGYSSSLPIVDEIYMKDGDGLDSIALFSPFMNLLFGHFTNEELSHFNDFLRGMQKNVLPYKSCLIGLLPILKKSNEAAYCKKFSTLFKDKVNLNNMSEVYAHFVSLIHKYYLYLKPLHYSTHECKKFIDPVFEFVDKEDSESLKLSLNTAGVMSEWYKNEAFPHIAKVVNCIEKLIPCMIYSVVGETGIFNRGKLNIVTISHEEASSLYKNGYEVFAHGLSYMVGIRNLMDSGSVDVFSNDGAKGINSLADFGKLPGGLMEDKLSDRQNIVCWIGNTMNHKVRNAASHDGIEYESETQIIECHYNPSNRADVYKLPLIELCDMVYMQLLHIMELTMLTFTIVSRSNTRK